MDFGKVLTAMVTPFDNRGNVDFEQTTILIDYLLANGTEGLVITGTTGESPTLSETEKIKLYQHVVKAVNKRVPVIAGTGSNNTASTIALTKEAEKCGVDGIMLVTPYYNKPNQQGLYQHFKSIAEETSLPIMLYNIPGRSSVNMSGETIIDLSKIDNIVSVKDASGDFNQVCDIIENTDKKFTVYSGEDGLTLPLMAVGTQGVVSVSSHIIGNEMQSMIKAFIAGNVQEAAEIHRQLLPIMTGLFKAPSPVPVKAALQMRGIEVGGVRLPLVELTESEKENLQKIIDEI
ncbi:4-hydroxy-tetrahydrodipicolinate synthase [Virgibacillus sp. MSJ-26]|uniref:4-hydroxy-tetrahydrodipicolinate synthase n=1 Tax=Virgibacillus sp. MSJ-26 TaxID=2841522 RepID=UPI001C11D35C|nr:4-hydroxy-tetrahydrodipicolinate synthase [Virgibacillus sp. MSJ-26]MBU5466723.1 4-hydroxy-tetrahydrodipicolinate synthase [Virgibacillus sp. MSJ-26]